nr:TPA_asm: hypothetical protein [Alternaria tenuissima negative-stranded RNA virus 2]
MVGSLHIDPHQLKQTRNNQINHASKTFKSHFKYAIIAGGRLCDLVLLRLSSLVLFGHDRWNFDCWVTFQGLHHIHDGLHRVSILVQDFAILEPGEVQILLGVRCSQKGKLTNLGIVWFILAIDLNVEGARESKVGFEQWVLHLIW